MHHPRVVVAIPLLCIALSWLEPRALGQTQTWDLAAAWNGQNPIDVHWSLSGGPEAHRWRGFESFGGDFATGCPNSFIVKCVGEPTTQDCPGSPHVVSLNHDEMAWHTDAGITWTAAGFCGSITINAVFHDHPGQNGITDLYVKKNGTQLWFYRLNGGSVTFTQTLAVGGDDRIEFSIGPGPDGMGEDTVNITSLVITGEPTTELPESTWQGDAKFHGGSWGVAANWDPSGVPADNATAAFQLVTQSFIDLDANRRIGTFGVNAGDVNLNFHGFTLSQPPTGCLLPAALVVGVFPSSTGLLSLTSDYPDGGGRYESRLPVAVGVGQGSTGVLTISTGVVLDSGAYVAVGFGDGAVGSLDLVSGGTVLVRSGVRVGGRDGQGTINVGAGGVLTFNPGTTFRLGHQPGATGILNIGNGGLVDLPGSNSQVLVGAESADEGGLTTIGEINLHTGGLLSATEIRLGAQPRTRGTMTMDGGDLTVRSLIIADGGDGTFNWSGGTIAGLDRVTIGNAPGTSGQLSLDGPANSLRFAGAGGEASIYAGKSGRGRLFVTGGATIDIISGSIGGLSIGADAPTAGGGVQIIGAGSAITGDLDTVLNVGKTYTIPLTIPALLLDDNAAASFGTILVGREPWMDGEIHVHNGSILAQVYPESDAVGAQNGFIVRGTPGATRLLVDSGGRVECTSGWAAGTRLGGDLVTVTGEGSTLACSGDFAVFGDLPEGSKMHVGEGATMTSGDVHLGYPSGGGPGFRGELSLEGPREVLNVSGTLFIGADAEPTSLGRLILQNGARVRTHRLALGAAYFVTNGTKNNPQLHVGQLRGEPDIQCDTLIVGDTFDLPDLDISVGPGAGIGGRGTWPDSFVNSAGGEVIAAGLPPGSYPPPIGHTSLTIAGNYTQSADSSLDVCRSVLQHRQNESVVLTSSRLVVTGAAEIAGVLRLSNCHPPTGDWYELSFDGILYWAPWAIGPVEVLTAASVTGQFDAVEFDPDFPTDRVQLTYEPTRVLVTLLPPVCDTQITQQPQGGAAAPGRTAAFAVEATTDEWRDLTFEWLADGPFCSGDPCFTPFEPAGPGSSVNDYQGPMLSSTGQGTPTLAVTVDPTYFSPGNRPRQLGVVCYVRDGCGLLVISSEATLSICPADFNGDGTVNSTDVSDFINAWFEDQQAGTLVTDWDSNGVVNSTDVSAFINTWFEDTAAGCG